MVAAGSRLRATAALSAGAYALHQLRYALGYGDASGEALGAHGHAYLSLLAPLVALLAALAGAQFLSILARTGHTSEDSGRTARLRRLWPAATGVLLAIYLLQELIEGALASGHPAGLAAILAGGGWWALPLAVVIGLLVALMLRGADAAIGLVASRRFVRRPRIATPLPTPVVLAELPRPAVLARNLAGRGPPIASV